MKDIKGTREIKGTQENGQADAQGGRHGLTERQADVLRFIRTFTEDTGYAPTVREIAEGMGTKSSGTAHGYVHALADGGYLVLAPGSPRSLTLTEKGKAYGAAGPCCLRCAHHDRLERTGLHVCLRCGADIECVTEPGAPCAEWEPADWI